MKYYIRTTHNFDNETRDWSFREELRNVRQTTYPFLLGVHGLERSHWMSYDGMVNVSFLYFRQQGEESGFEVKNLTDEELKSKVIDSLDKDLPQMVSLGLIKERDYEFPNFK